MPYTNGFKTTNIRDDHWQKHPEFGLPSPASYESAADAFLGGPLPAGCHEQIRIRDGATIRYDPATGEFGVVGADNYIRTYFKPDPAIHGFRDNLQYFLYDASKP
jgi:filamentous hemagglutinin